MGHAEYIKKSMLSFREVAADTPQHRKLHDMSADYHLVDYATIAMKEKLKQARDKGRGGWWDPNQCTIQQLRDMLAEHVTKGDMRDVMNIAAMIYVRDIADDDVPEWLDIPAFLRRQQD